MIFLCICGKTVVFADCLVVSRPLQASEADKRVVLSWQMQAESDKPSCWWNLSDFERVPSYSVLCSVLNGMHIYHGPRRLRWATNGFITRKKNEQHVKVKARATKIVCWASRLIISDLI